MKNEAPRTVFLRDYRKPDFLIHHSDLEIKLDYSETEVVARHSITRSNRHAGDLVLHCEFVEVTSVSINGEPVSSGAWHRDSDSLTVKNVPDEFELEIRNSLDPSKNTALSGLYKSANILCTQCEAEGFRRITPAIDRPDNLGTYRVKLVADKSDFPVLLCNGNLVEKGEVTESTHYAVWQDPFPKPTYLFAIVAGDLDCLEDHFTTMNGRQVTLRFYARESDIDKCHHAMQSLKLAMRWDEEVYGREYDLDLFNVVAVEDFNMGAMENKSLNIFNTKFVLADPRMAADEDFQNVQSVIGHEYFHNWSGNRVTCRDWFQLSLKEGFTVFRDQSFSADMGSRGVKRIDDVNLLRAYQFKEDASPMAHPVRPDSYQEINNFYTATVYNKGAEVIRMLQTILGTKSFLRGTDDYFERYDGQAVTTDDFVAAMESAGNVNLTQFKNWYSQAGTPRIDVECQYDPPENSYRITLKQSCPDTPGQTAKSPFVIPVKMALFDPQGEKMPVDGRHQETTLILDEPSKTFSFHSIRSRPIPSLLRDFSAPVEINLPLGTNHLEFLLRHDDDPFNRWESGQKLFLAHLLETVSCIQKGDELPASDRLASMVSDLLDTGTADPAFVAKLITLPNIPYLSEQVSPIDPPSIQSAVNEVKFQIARASRKTLMDTYHQCQANHSGKVNHREMAERSLRNACLDYLCALDDTASRALCLEQLENSTCMTDTASAIFQIARSSRSDRQDILEEFYIQWKEEPLVIDKWLRFQATAPRNGTLKTVNVLTEHPGFDYRNPNKVYSLILGFSHGNPCCLHASDGSGYAFVQQWIEKLDPVNPQIAARLASSLNGWKRYTPGPREKMKQALQSISALPGLSRDVSEIVEKNLA